MEKQKRCKQCRGVIKPKDHQVALITKNEGKVTESVHFHINCWAEYFNKAVTNRAKENISSIQSKVQGLMENPMLKGILAQVKGNDALVGMLNTDLSKTIEDLDLGGMGLGVAPKKKVKKKVVKKKSVKKEDGKKTNKKTKK